MAKSKEILRSKKTAAHAAPPSPTTPPAEEKITKTIRENLHLDQFQNPIVRSPAEALGHVSDIETKRISGPDLHKEVHRRRGGRYPTRYGPGRTSKGFSLLGDGDLRELELAFGGVPDEEAFPLDLDEADLDVDKDD